MSVQDFPAVNQVAPIGHSPEYAWGMALYSFMMATETICEMAKGQPYRDMAVDDLSKITEATLAVNLMWSQLKKREAA
jgi:hypothetical protein